MLIANLCCMLGLEVSEDNVGLCELKHFDKLKASELKAFIIACHPKYMKLSDVGHLKNPREVKSKEEASTSVENCISVAFGVHNEKSSLIGINKRLDDNIVAPVVTVLTSRISLSGLKSIEIKSSDILEDHAKVDLLFSIFDANGTLSSSNIRKAIADSNMFADILKKANLILSCFLHASMPM